MQLSRKTIGAVIVFFAFFGFGVGIVLPGKYSALRTSTHASIPSEKLQSSEYASVSLEELQANAFKVFENRCIACHSCYNAPCQLNLTSYEGFLRGGTKHLLYNSSRLAPIDPTRLYTDGQSVEEWRQKGFHPVAAFAPSADPKNFSDSIFWQLIMQRAYVKSAAKIPSEESHTCPSTMAEAKQFIKDRPEAGMPYGLPALSEPELKAVAHWLSNGAPGPKDETDVKRYLGANELQVLREWERFFNGADLKTKVVSRYIYEHLFLAHIHFAQVPNHFFRLVRSKTSCEQGVEEIATVRPFDDPKTENFEYCFRRLPGAPVEKSHIVYPLNPQKMARFKELFFGNDWQATRLPSWKPDEAANPFVTFSEIPGRSRYQFLLDDAQYHVMTFIKGPVCKGNTAVNSIEEQFLVLFLDPASDPYSTSPEFAARAAELNRLPGQRGSDLIEGKQDAIDIWNLGIIRNRNAYRQYRDDFYGKTKPQGYGLEDIWDGDGTNNNALLTVLRHYDSATVVKGAVGDVSKTAFVLDYVLFERLSYDLVSGFDVFGSLGHQGFTRIYMALIRMEAEELFLSFLPSKQRKELREYWYRGVLTQRKMKQIYPQLGLERPTNVQFAAPDRAKQEFFEQLFAKRMPTKVRGTPDPVNWKQAGGAIESQDPKVAAVEREFRKVTSRTVKSGAKYVLQFPDVSFIRVRMGGDGSQDLVYSLIRNKEHTNIAWIKLIPEEVRRDYDNDTIYITRGFVGSFPNRFFNVDADKIGEFVQDMSVIKDQLSAQGFISKYGVRRADPKFWESYDWFNWKAKQLDPVYGGVYDLNRYENPQSELE